ncbi:MAG: NUDIX hydrolase [Elainellaceae cyanobacterium]
MDPQWLKWAKELQAIAQIGLTFSTENSLNSFDVQRYTRLREIATEILSIQGDLEHPVVLEILQQEKGYATPKVDVRGVVFRDDKILMVKEVSDGGWTLPGGWADVNETPRESVTREIREESGYETQPTKLLCVFDRSKHAHTPLLPFHVYKLFIRCELTGGEPRTSIETSDVGFFGEDELPVLSTSRVLASQIQRFFEHYRNPDLPTDFD